MRGLLGAAKFEVLSPERENPKSNPALISLGIRLSGTGAGRSAATTRSGKFKGAKRSHHVTPFAEGRELLASSSATDREQQRLSKFDLA